MKNTAAILKTSAMAVSIPRYVGILFYASGLAWVSTWSALHIAELVAGCALALLEGFAISYMVDRVQLNTSKVEQGITILVALLLLLLLPLAAVPSMYFAYSGTHLFYASPDNAYQTVFTCGWLFAVAAMPILIIVGVGLTQSDPMERKLKQAEKQAETEQRIAELEAITEQRIAEMKARTQQTLLTYQLENRQTKAEFKQKSGAIEQEFEQTAATNKLFVCDCKQTFASQKALNGHRAHCKVKSNGYQVEPVGIANFNK